MIPNRYEWLYSRRYVLECFLLAALAGAVNSGGFIACHRAVSHVTGFVTLFGAEMGFGRPLEALGLLTIPGFFVLGALVSGYFVDRRRDKGLFEGYETPLWVVAASLLIVVVGGYLGLFGDFGEEMLFARDYVLMALLSGSCGILNAVASSASGSLVRVTHLTGMATDIGIGISRIVRPRLKGEVLARERLLLIFRCGIIAAFIVGSLLGAYTFVRFRYVGFLLPLGMSILAGVLAHVFQPSETT